MSHALTDLFEYENCMSPVHYNRGVVIFNHCTLLRDIKGANGVPYPEGTYFDEIDLNIPDMTLVFYKDDEAMSWTTCMYINIKVEVDV